MDLRSLRYFVAVLEAGSLTRAAEHLFVAQPALTARIKQLEAEFDTRLLERSHAGVSPTAMGQQLYEEAKRLLDEADALRLRMNQSTGKAEGTVTLAFPALLAPTLLGQLLLQVQERFPKITLRVIDEASLGTLGAVRDGRADFGLLVDPPAIVGLARHPVARESIYLTGTDPQGVLQKKLRQRAGKPQAARARAAEPCIRFVDAAALPLVMQSRSYATRRKAQELARSLGVRLNVVHEQDSINALRALARVGGYFLFSPACAAFRGAPEGSTRVRRARIVEPELHRSYALSWLQGRQLSRAAQEVVGVLREQVAAAITQRRWVAEHLDRPDDHIF